MGSYRFYNGGDAIKDRLPFDNPVNDIKVDNIVSYYRFEVEAQSYVDVPDSIEVGRRRAFTNFDLTIMSKWGRMGMVRVDPEVDPEYSATPTARNDREAKIKGDEIHAEYLMQMVQDYVNRVEEAKAQGITILPAQGYTKHALKKLGIPDPALSVKNLVEKQRASEANSEVAELRAQVALLTSMIVPKPQEKAAKA